MKLSTLSENHYALKHERYKGIKHIWIDKPKAGELILAHVTSIGAISIEIWAKRDKPLDMINRLKFEGWDIVIV